jgi:hypothetical protein
MQKYNLNYKFDYENYLSITSTIGDTFKFLQDGLEKIVQVAEDNPIATSIVIGVTVAAGVGLYLNGKKKRERIKELLEFIYDDCFKK